MTYMKQKVELYKKLADNTWSPTAINLTTARDVKTSYVLGKGRDTFNFKIFNPNNKLFEQKFSGDAAIKEFTLTYAPPSSMVNDEAKSVRVFVDDVEQTYTTDYTIYDSQTKLLFSSAPGAGSQNIVVKFNVIEAEDKIRIYFWKDSLTYTTDNLVMEGTITEPSEEITVGNAKDITVRGTTFFEILMNGLAFALRSTTPANNKAYLFIQRAIAQLNQYNPTKNLYGQDTIEWNALSNPITKADGSAFPIVSYSSSYKRAIEIVEELSSDKYTEDGQYIYYVQYNATTGNYEFIWRSKSPDIDYFINETEGTQGIKIRKATEDVVNAIIYNAGLSPKGVPIEYPAFDFSAQAANGAKWKYLTSTDKIAGNLINEEFTNNLSDWDQTSEGLRKSNFPKAGSYPYDMQFTTRDDEGRKTTTTNTVADDDAFNDAIEIEARYRGEAEAMRVIGLFGNPRYKCQFTIKQDTSYELGGFFQINIPSFGVNSKKLRLVQIDHSLWTTTLYLEEDEQTVLEEAT